MALVYHSKPTMGTQYIPGHRLGPSGGLVAQWLLNERGGDIVYDATQNKNTGTLTNMTPATAWGVGPGGSIVKCGVPEVGSDDYIQTTFDGSQYDALSLVVWMRRYVDETGDSQYIVDNSPGHTGYCLRYRNATNKWEAFVYADGGNIVGPKTFGTVPDAEWHQLGFAYSDGDLYLYIDGQPDGSKITAQTGIADTMNTACISAEHDGTERIIAEYEHLAFYNRHLTAEDFLQLFADPYCMFAAEDKYRIWMKPAALAAGNLPLLKQTNLGNSLLRRLA